MEQDPSDVIENKNRSEQEQQSLEIAEASREVDWKSKSFVASLYMGDLDLNLCFPYPYQADEDKKIGEWMKSLEPEDLLKYGLIPEFIGRLPITATLEDLDQNSLVKILQEPKNSLIKQYQELFKLEGVKLTFKENAIKEIATKAINKKTGARGLRSILENILLKTMFDLPGQENIEEVIIDLGVVKGESQPIVVHSKNNKVKTDKSTAA